MQMRASGGRLASGNKMSRVDPERSTRSKRTWCTESAPDSLWIHGSGCCCLHRRTRSRRSLRPGHISPAEDSISVVLFFKTCDEHKESSGSTAELPGREHDMKIGCDGFPGELPRCMTSAPMYFYSCQTQHDSHGRGFSL